MANPLVKLWNYLMAALDSKIEENADPKVQIQQTIEDAQRQHQEPSQQVAAVIDNQRQLGMCPNRQLAEIEKLQGNIRQVLQLADKTHTEGDTAKAMEYESAAEAFAAQLVTAEQSVGDLKALHDQSPQQAAQAKKTVERSSMQLQQKAAKRAELLSQLEQAKMQEKASESLQSMNQISSGVTPNLDQVRDRIERRYANALGQVELAQNSVQGRMAEVEAAGVQLAGHSRLEQVRAEMNNGNELSGGEAQKSIGGSVASNVDPTVAGHMCQLREGN